MSLRSEYGKPSRLSCGAITAVLVSHSGTRCGVYQFGRRLFHILRGSGHRRSQQIDWIYAECDSLSQLRMLSAALQQDITVFNYHPQTMPWAEDTAGLEISGTTFGVFHEVYQGAADLAVNRPFDYFLCPDPTLIPRNPVILPVPRFIPEYQSSNSTIPDLFTVGSFGFATKGKGFERLCQIVNDQFDQARIRINVPFHDNLEIVSRLDMSAVEAVCREKITKKGIKLEFTHDFFSEEELIGFLSENTLNAFLYEEVADRGISSCTDYALASGRPITISKSSMFRHLHDLRPSICFEDRGLREIAANGIELLKGHIREYSSQQAGDSWTAAICNAVERQAFSRGVPDREGFNKVLSVQSRVAYNLLTFEILQNQNKISNDSSRQNMVEQAFVLDTVQRLAHHYENPQLLAVGLLGNPAVEVLQRKGYDIAQVGIDNREAAILDKSYALRNYDIVICVSILNKIKEDGLFLRKISSILKPGGIAILTFDFSENYPMYNFRPNNYERLYCAWDIEHRLVASLSDCTLIDTSRWRNTGGDLDCDELYYNAASLVFRKLENIQAGRVPERSSPENGASLISRLHREGRVIEGVVSNTSHRERVKGGVIFRSSGQDLDYIMYGPYIRLAEGAYRALVIIRLDEGSVSKKGTPIALLDIAADGAGLEFKRYLTISDLALNEFVPISLEFVLDHPTARWEFRVLLVQPVKLSIVAGVAVRSVFNVSFARP